MHAALLLTGEKMDLLELFPELAMIRDATFLFKLTFASLGKLPTPDVPNMRASDAELHWTYNAERGRYDVRGYRGMSLDALQPGVVSAVGGGFAGAAAGAAAGMFAKGKDLLFGGNQGVTQVLFGAQKTATTSGADPSVLAGQVVENEEDILSLKELPDFDGLLNPEDSELLLTYLTAPYLRIPLTLGFFQSRDRINCLRNPKLQQVMESVLFECGEWLSPEMAQKVPEKIPSEDRDFLATEWGLLFNELLLAPEVILSAVFQLLDYAMEKDTGRATPGSEPLILFTVRLACRVNNFLGYLVNPSSRVKIVNPDAGSDGDRERARALLEHLRSAKKPLEEKLTGIRKLLLRWIDRALRSNEAGGTIVAAKCYAHLALLFHATPVADMDWKECAMLLAAQVFTAQNYGVDRDGKRNVLGVSEMELFDVFDAKRVDLFRRMSGETQSFVSKVRAEFIATELHE